MSTINWSPSTSLFRREPPTTVVLGEPGSGKTFFLLNIAANEIGLGRTVFCLDMKNDFLKLKNISSNVTLIDINEIEDGALNPFIFLDDIDNLTLTTLVEILCGKFSNSAAVEVKPILQDFILRYKRDNEYTDMQDVADYLFSRDSKEAQVIGNELNSFGDSRLGKLLFTRKVNKTPLKFSLDTSVVISLHGLTLPDYNIDIEDYNADERFTSAIIYLITKKLRSILTKPRKAPCVMIFEEAHLSFSNQAMSKVMIEIMSLGSSLNVASVLSSQGVQNFPDISKYVSSKFMFKNSIKESETFLENYDGNKYDSDKALNIPSIVTSIANFQGKGKCFFIDSQGRSGFLQIKSVYDPKLLSTKALDRV